MPPQLGGIPLGGAPLGGTQGGQQPSGPVTGQIDVTQAIQTSSGAGYVLNVSAVGGGAPIFDQLPKILKQVVVGQISTLQAPATSAGRGRLIIRGTMSVTPRGQLVGIEAYQGDGDEDVAVLVAIHESL